MSLYYKPCLDEAKLFYGSGNIELVTREVTGVWVAYVLWGNKIQQHAAVADSEDSAVLSLRVIVSGYNKDTKLIEQQGVALAKALSTIDKLKKNDGYCGKFGDDEYWPLAAGTYEEAKAGVEEILEKTGYDEGELYSIKLLGKVIESNKYSWEDKD